MDITLLRKAEFVEGQCGPHLEPGFRAVASRRLAPRCRRDFDRSGARQGRRPRVDLQLQRNRVVDLAVCCSRPLRSANLIGAVEQEYARSYRKGSRRCDAIPERHALGGTGRGPSGSCHDGARHNCTRHCTRNDRSGNDCRPSRRCKRNFRRVHDDRHCRSQIRGTMEQLSYGAFSADLHQRQSGQRAPHAGFD
jgi:hypothetical protein